MTTEWPNLCVLLLTYDRLGYAERTLESTLDRLSYSGRLSVHVADDGTGPEYRERLVELAGGYACVQGVSVSNSEQGGYGKSYNLALQVIHAHCDVVLPLEDDWELRRPLDLDYLVSVQREGGFGCIRLGYLGITAPARGELLNIQDQLWLRFDPDSEERHIFSGHPRLETREWERSVGPWPEGLNPNQTEFNVSAIPAARENVVWPLSMVRTQGDLFAHIGAERARHVTAEAELVSA